MRSKAFTKAVVGSPEWKRSLLTSRRKWEDEYYRNIVWTDFICLRIGTVVGFCGRADEPLSFYHRR
jgi:hypothetical protein